MLSRGMCFIVSFDGGWAWMVLIEIVPKGSKITFTTESFGLGFFVGQRKVCICFCYGRDVAD